ncbi:Mpv17-like protein 2 [Geodia barretti]|uniref:Mitochondrial inner membrane protein Mpv17 n=1 Tax=Geodia barretti TaxID=519541 RepID=A0AA35WQT4_GEOBA|nr:Mpv17-like protein 2 [Geodia barretti]
MSRHTVYLRRLLLGRYLIVTNTVSAGTLDGLADAVEQCGVESIQPHDWPRTLRMGTTGLLLGPVDHCWYRFLDSRFPGSHAAAVAKKVALDSLMYLPVGIVLFYTLQIINFRYVPVVLRVIFQNAIDFVWTMVMSYLKHRDLHNTHIWDYWKK